jgi:hypothetical protein
MNANQALPAQSGLTIKIVDPDQDYVGIEIRAANGRFAGSAAIYAALDDLRKFADRIAGFPSNPEDERDYEFGARGPAVAGGYCHLRFVCLDRAGHAAVDVQLEDDSRRHSGGSALFRFLILAAAVDRFTDALHGLDGARSGSATLCASELSD